MAQDRNEDRRRENKRDCYVYFLTAPYYPFSGGATDASGNGNDGVVQGAVLTADRFDSPGSAYLFDGASSNITVSDGPALEPNALSISFWLNASRYCPAGSIRSDIIAKDGQGGRQWTSQLEESGRIRTATFTDDEYTFDSDISIALNTWYHVVRVWDGATSSVYIDTVLHGSMATPGNLRSGSAPVVIGGNGTQYFQGKLDDIRIYARALTMPEICRIYAEERTGIAAKPQRRELAGLRLGVTMGLGSGPVNIEYFPDATSLVGLRILSATGAVVKDLFTGTCGNRPHVFVWDRTNALGHPVSKGIYVLQAESTQGRSAASRPIALK